MNQVCENCGSTERLEEHHISYYPESNRNPFKTVQTPLFYAIAYGLLGFGW